MAVYDSISLDSLRKVYYMYVDCMAPNYET